MDLFISNPTHSIRCSLELLMDVEHLVSLSKSISEMHLAFHCQFIGQIRLEDKILGTEQKQKCCLL